MECKLDLVKSLIYNRNCIRNNILEKGVYSNDVQLCCNLFIYICFREMHFCKLGKDT